MKIRFLAVGRAPDYYDINPSGIVTAYRDGQSHTFDFTSLQEGMHLDGAAQVAGVEAIHEAHLLQGELWITLAQEVGPGHWRESDWMDPTDYDPDMIQVVEHKDPFSGTPYVRTRRGNVNPRGGE